VSAFIISSETVQINSFKRKNPNQYRQAHMCIKSHRICIYHNIGNHSNKFIQKKKIKMPYIVEVRRIDNWELEKKCFNPKLSKFIGLNFNPKHFIGLNFTVMIFF
jgi:hypothetical protein